MRPVRITTNPDPATTWIQITIVFAALIFQVGCGQDTMTGDITDSTTADIVDAVNDAPGIPDASDVVTVDVLDSNEVPDTAPVDVETGCDDWTYIDFPCYSRFECRSLTSFNEMETYWCDVPCCSGGMCNVLGTYECPEGTACYDGYYDEEGSVDTPCRGDECNVAEGRLCDDGYFCETVPGNCGGSGVCQRVYVPDGTGNEQYYRLFDGEDSWTYICGCDGETRFSTWDRLEDGVSPDHEGPCCDTKRLGLTQENTAADGVYVACVDWTESRDLERLPDDLKALLNEADYGFVGMLSGCLGGQSAYIGDLKLTESGAIDQEQFNALCMLASFQAVASLTGQPADYCETLTCYSGLRCDEECQSACGCCPCNKGDRRCTDDNATESCTDEGCWSYHFPCTNDTHCVSDEQGVSCRSEE